MTRGAIAWLAAMSFLVGAITPAEKYLLELVARCAFDDRGTEVPS